MMATLEARLLKLTGLDRCVELLRAQCPVTVSVEAGNRAGGVATIAVDNGLRQR